MRVVSSESVHIHHNAYTIHGTMNRHHVQKKVQCRAQFVLLYCRSLCEDITYQNYLSYSIMPGVEIA